jgi:hypothetical protein
MMEHTQTIDIVHVILRYLKQHPRSEDTLDGITDWWVKKQRWEDSRVAVDEALKCLASEEIISVTTRNHVTYYKLN